MELEFELRLDVAIRTQFKKKKVPRGQSFESNVTVKGKYSSDKRRVNTASRFKSVPNGD